MGGRKPSKVTLCCRTAAEDKERSPARYSGSIQSPKAFFAREKAGGEARFGELGPARYLIIEFGAGSESHLASPPAGKSGICLWYMVQQRARGAGRVTDLIAIDLPTTIQPSTPSFWPSVSSLRW
jgi:hypothetical protein